MNLLGVELGAPAAQRRELGRLLEQNARMRNVFDGQPGLAKRLLRVQKWQSKRLLRSHADLHKNPRYRLAVEFFFNELYGGEARRRDTDLIKVQGAMAHLLPREALQSLCLAVRLEIISQELDAAVARSLGGETITVAKYAKAYRQAGHRADREKQIELTTEIGHYLDGVVHKPMVRALVKLARGPAHAAGFGLLQEFLERGLDAFEAMHGADEFLRVVRERETRAMVKLLGGADDPFDFARGPKQQAQAAGI